MTAIGGRWGAGALALLAVGSLAAALTIAATGGGDGSGGDWSPDDVEAVSGEGGCAPPLEVQIGPACERHAARERPPRGLTIRRGVPSTRDLGRVDLHTADAIATVSALRPRAAASGARGQRRRLA